MRATATSGKRAARVGTRTIPPLDLVQYLPRLLYDSLHGDRGSPTVAIHLNFRLGPLPLKDSGVGSRFLAQAHWLTVVPVDLRRHFVFP